LFWNTFIFGNTNTTSPDQLTIDVGGYNPVIGTSYGELAAKSRSQHKSQGFGVPSSRGSQKEFFMQWEGPGAKNDPMEDIDISWNKIPGGEAIDASIDEILKTFSLADPSLSVKPLVNLYKQVGSLPDSYWKTQKDDEIRKLIVDCSGLWIEA